MNGGSGNDAVFFAGSVSDYTFEFTGRKVFVSNGVETDTLTNIEQVMFGADPDDADMATFLITNAELIALVPAPPEPAPPEPAPPGPTPPQPPSGLDAFEAEVLSLVNEFRPLLIRKYSRTSVSLSVLNTTPLFESSAFSSLKLYISPL